METICFSIQSGIGNTVLATPALKAIKIARPECKLHLVAWERTARIAEGLPFLDGVCSSNDVIKYVLELGKVEHLIMSPIGSIYHHMLRQVVANIHNHPMKAPFLKHEMEVNMDFAYKLGFRGITPDASVKLEDKNKEFAANFISDHELQDGYVCVNASYLKSEHWALKHWGNDKYRQLVHWLWHKYYLPIVFVGSLSDHNDAASISKNIEPYSVPRGSSVQPLVNACGVSKDIKDTAALIAGSKCLIGNDGGLQHIAAALKIKTITIFTFTSIIKNRPLNGAVCFVPCNNRVWCQHGQYEHCGTNGCLDVPIEGVMERIEEVMEARL